MNIKKRIKGVKKLQTCYFFTLTVFLTVVLP